MEYSLYINQIKAVEWDLSAGEAHIFSYLINSIGWATPHPEKPGYFWFANAKLAEELPWICKHKGTAARHVSALESKGLVNRTTHKNKSYVRITQKGATWKSSTIKVNESVEPEQKRSTNRLNSRPKVNESVEPRVNESVDQSDIPIKSNIKIEGVRPKKPTTEYIQDCIDAYHKHLPAPKHPAVFEWGDKQKRARNLTAIWNEYEISHKPGFWDAYFQEVAATPFMTGKKPFPNGDVFYTNIEYALRRDKFVDIVEASLSSAV